MLITNLKDREVYIREDGRKRSVGRILDEGEKASDFPFVFNIEVKFGEQSQFFRIAITDDATARKILGGDLNGFSIHAESGEAKKKSR